MTELFEITDPHDHRLAAGVTGSLAVLNEAGLLTSGDLRTAETVCRLGGESSDDVALAVALLVRAARHGSVCLDLRDVPALLPDPPAGLAWPDPAAWLAAITASPLTGVALRVEGQPGPGQALVYLHRYWADEGAVVDDLRERTGRAAPAVDDARLAAALERLFPPEFAEQRAAAADSARRWTSVITGGPGTGKTTTLARLLAVLVDQSPGIRIALAAPTGKAAARMSQALAAAAARDDFPAGDRAAVSGLTASTLHRLLGFRPDNHSRFRHHRGNRLPHDVVVVDETSMVSLPMMARLVEAIRPDARLVLLGDADQLASVEAGAVLHDVVAGFAEPESTDGRRSEPPETGAMTRRRSEDVPGRPSSDANDVSAPVSDGAAGGHRRTQARRTPTPVSRLQTSHRFGFEIGALAAAVRDGDAEHAWSLLSAGSTRVELINAADTIRIREVTLPGARALRAAALAGDHAAALGALSGHRLLCAHREGAFGLRHWNEQIATWLREAEGLDWLPARYPGQPLLQTSNDYGLKLWNGDTGVVLAGEERRAIFDDGGAGRVLSLARLSDVEVAHALTVHRSQGSEFGEVTVVLPQPDSRLLTRQLLYTAVTRAVDVVRVVGTEESVKEAVRRQAARASGLAQRLA